MEKEKVSNTSKKKEGKGKPFRRF